MPKVKLTTVFEFEQEIDLPEECPHCRADLRQPHALKVWYYADEGASARLPAEADNPRDIEGGVVYHWDAARTAGDGFIDRVAYWCMRCTNSLAEASRWDLNVSAGASSPDSRLEDDEHYRELECGCVLRRAPVQIEFCQLHRGIMPYAERLRRGIL